MGGCTSTAAQGSTSAIVVLPQPWRSMLSKLWSNHNRYHCYGLQLRPLLPKSSHTLIVEPNRTFSAPPAAIVREAPCSSHTISSDDLFDGSGPLPRSGQQLRQVFDLKGLAGACCQFGRADAGRRLQIGIDRKALCI